MSEKTVLVCCENLQERIDAMMKYIKIAENLLAQGDYLQCAVRLQLAAREAQFDDLQLNIFDSISEKSP